MAEKFKKADQANPYMGLNNQVCENPCYWCTIHEIWLSEEDAKEKHCLAKPTFDMMEVKKCNNLIRKRG